MVLRLLSTLCIACAASAAPRYGNALECHFDKTYALIAATDLRAVLELRAYEGDQVIDSVVLSSRYKPPEFEAKFLVSDDKPQFIIRTRDGGTGIAETHCIIYGVDGDHIRKLGDFVVERSAHSWPDSDYSEKLSGKVSFPRMGMLTYRYKQTVTKKRQTTTKSVTEKFSFNPKRMRYEKAENR